MIGRDIQDKRRAMGLTQTELGEMCGVNWKSISNLEREANVNYKLLKRVCNALGLELKVVDTKPIERNEKKPIKNNKVSFEL